MSSQKDELIFLPLGGAGEIGMNLNLYGLGDPKDPTWLMVDFGITFGDGSPPGVDLITPDPTFIEKRRDRLGADPRPRRPSRCRALSVGAYPLPDLCNTVHHGNPQAQTERNQIR